MVEVGDGECTDAEEDRDQIRIRHFRKERQISIHGIEPEAERDGAGYYGRPFCHSIDPGCFRPDEDHENQTGNTQNLHVVLRHRLEGDEKRDDLSGDEEDKAGEIRFRIRLRRSGRQLDALVGG